jgi:hypothetical protein
MHLWCKQNSPIEPQIHREKQEKAPFTFCKQNGPAEPHSHREKQAEISVYILTKFEAMKKRAKRASNTNSTGRNLVTFELSPEAFAALQRDATKHNVASNHQRAREIILDYLANRDVTELRTSLASIEAKLLNVATLVKKNSFAVLHYASKMDVDKANGWIKTNMTDGPTK